MEKIVIPQEIMQFRSSTPDDLWFATDGNLETFDSWVAKQLGVKDVDEVVFVMFTGEVSGVAESFMLSMESLSENGCLDKYGVHQPAVDFEGFAAYVEDEEEPYEVAELSTIPGSGVIFEYSDGGFGVYFASPE